ncbi:SUN domain-containing ossification factor isoform X2 [Oopsacas minuta]|uniref:SUN domain-containing ossification factor isoform X2 n=1 Tax=Oopsacas minuta TaxID=111878 RepID=A0AAV7K1U5_9METZ|nr:SUN domain-containing ossification factor isoform X2 [Oopsacas minuta]
MSSKFMHSLKLLSCAWILLICYLLTSVSHTADTSEGAQELPYDVNYSLDSLEPALPVIEDEQEDLQNSVGDESDISSDSSNEISIEWKVGLDNGYLEQQIVDNIDIIEQNTVSNDPVIDPNLSEENTDSDQNDLLQLPTMDEFITQNTNGAINTDPLPSDGIQTPTTSATNSFEQNTKTHETPPKQKNYASADCGAKIVARNPESRNTAGILNENRDDYMLNKCSLESIWVTVELCDYIQVLSIELSVHELFSSLPENFTMSLSLQGGVKPDDWLPPTLFTAKNIRGDQIFRVPTLDQHHARFVKLNLVSHYGNEHYCPITTLRVFGANYVEVLEAIERGSGTQAPAVETSLHLDNTDSELDEFEKEQILEGDKPKEGFFTNALDGLYKYVWPEDEQNPSVNINVTQTSSDNNTVNPEIITDEVIEEEKDPPLPADDLTTETLENEFIDREESVSGLVNLSNVTEDFKILLNDYSPHSMETIEPANEIHLNVEATIQEDTYDDEDEHEKYNNNEENISNTPSDDNSIEDTVSLETDELQSDATPKIELSQGQTVEEANSMTSDNEVELSDDSTQNITDSIPTISNATHVENNSLPDAASNSTPKDPPIPSTPPTSQNYLVRMQERIARLGENVTIIHKYLDQFRHSIQRNVNRTEEVQRSLERKLSQLEDLVNLTLLNSYIQSEEVEITKIYWTDIITSLTYEIQYFKAQLLLCFLTTLIIIIIIAAISVKRSNAKLRQEMNSLCKQLNGEIQKLLYIIQEDRKKLKNGYIRNYENDYFEGQLTDQGVLSDSNLNSYVNHTAKKKKKTRKNSNLVLPYP